VYEAETPDKSILNILSRNAVIFMMGLGDGLRSGGCMN
jgi:hypothetical protein